MRAFHLNVADGRHALLSSNVAFAASRITSTGMRAH